MANLATWMRRSDEKYFAPFLARYPEVELCNAARRKVPIEQMKGLLLTGGPDIAAECLNQPVPDPSVLDKDVHADRDRWELDAIKKAIERGLPILAICKGLQTLNVALGGTLHLDIRGHDLPDQKTHDIQPLRSDSKARHRFEKVNSSHHQAIERGLPIFAICKGLQTVNVALGGTLRLDIRGHNLPDQKTHDIQLLRSDRKTRHRFEKVNSSHHQAIDQLGAGLEVESWCATDDIIEQVRLRDYPFALAVQYHPERGQIYDELFDDFMSRVADSLKG